MAKKDRKPKKLVMTRFKKTAPKPAKPLSKPRPARKPRGTTAAPASKPKVKAAAPATAKGSTRTEDLKALLRTPGGVTLDTVQAKFGWLAHSARAAISRAGGIGQKIGGVTIYSLPTAQAAE